jgi:hypothetical protein
MHSDSKDSDKIAEPNRAGASVGFGVIKNLFSIIVLF